MARTANVFTRVDPDIKEQAETILEKLGIPMSSAVGIFLRQVVLHNGLPFDVKLPASIPLAYGSLSKEEFDREIEKGFSDVREGRVYSADEAEASLKEELGL